MQISIHLVSIFPKLHLNLTICCSFFQIFYLNNIQNAIKIFANLCKSNSPYRIDRENFVATLTMCKFYFKVTDPNTLFL